MTDDYGMKFAKARKQFDYQLVKKCLLTWGDVLVPYICGLLFRLSFQNIYAMV